MYEGAVPLRELKTSNKNFIANSKGNMQLVQVMIKIMVILASAFCTGCSEFVVVLLAMH